MLKRKFYDYLLNWKKEKKQECLIVNGARQIGKTYIIDYFGQTNYKSYIYINFDTNPSCKEIFDGDLDVNTIYEKLSFYFGGDKLISGDTLIFLDELQECPRARTALKPLAIDSRYDVICSGSYLGLNYKGITSIPVGYERQVSMYSLDFEEFMWALGKDEATINLIKEHFDSLKPFDDSLNKDLNFLFRLYMVIGGMPEVVNNYLEYHDFTRVHNLQGKIIDSYLGDIKRYSPSILMSQKIEECFNSIHRQLLKPYDVFRYSSVGRHGDKDKYKSAINWLVAAGIVSKCYKVTKCEIPLDGYVVEYNFKIYFNDIGLLSYMFGLTTQKEIYDNKLVGEAKGGIYENAIASVLLRNGYKLYYYKDNKSTKEIEFLIEKDEGVIPLEVKSSKGQSTPSLDFYLENYHPKVSYKISDSNLGYIENKVSIPYYMSIFL
ncbi:MAG: AAA family ATPase [Coprobacillus sp.]|nr:AAA family ATPase [Coprobacillus sp.]